MEQQRKGTGAARAKAHASADQHAVQREAELHRRPRTPDELRAWMERVLGLRVPATPLVPGHSTPLDYLVHAFFEGAWRRAPGGEGWEVVPPERATRDGVLWACRGGGKTFLGAVATLLDLIFKPGIEVRVLGGSMEQSKRMHAHLRRLICAKNGPALGELLGAKLTQTSLRLANGSEVELLAQSQASVRGTRVQKLRCDEVELFDPEVWDAAQLVTRGRTLRTPDGEDLDIPGVIECLSTMHIPHGLMHDLVEECKAGKRALFKWGVVDVLEECPAARACAACALHPECDGRAKGRGGGHVRIDDALAAKARVSRATWDSEMLCLRPTRSDAVLPEFDPALHVVEREPSEGVVVAGMDFGYRSPAVVLWGMVDAGGVLWIVDERVVEREVVGAHVESILAGRGRREGHAWPRPAWVGVDPAGGQSNDHSGTSSIQLLERAQLRVRSRRCTIQGGLELVRARLRPAQEGAAPRLLVHARCTTLRECLARYHYARDKPGSLDPVKDGFDHAVDALRYLVLNLDRPGRAVMGEYAG